MTAHPLARRLTIIAVMFLLFVLALVLPFPSGHGGDSGDGGEDL